MCLDNIEEIAAAVAAAKKAKSAFDNYKATPNIGGVVSLEVTEHEAFRIFEQRAKDAEQALKDLGFRGPLAKAAPADAADTARVMNARMP